ncbi:hypothetical protein PG994_009164 [Apiospora phragmitis]|uniref:Uncharacterized protein n=1 Tax=Apiospora phragmitis TaxID=2905665 RepID=A0ABR1UKV9_9PEZI
MANPDAHRKVMRRSAALIPPRAGRAQDDPMPMTIEDRRRLTARRQQQIGATSRRVKGADLRRRAACSRRAVRAASSTSAERPQPARQLPVRFLPTESSLLRHPQIWAERLVGRPYDAANFFPFQLSLAIMCLMNIVMFRDACLCDHWKSGPRRGLEISGRNLAASCFGSKTVSMPWAGSFLPLPARSEGAHDEIVRRIRAIPQGNRTKLCLHCASRYSRNRWAII